MPSNTVGAGKRNRSRQREENNWIREMEELRQGSPSLGHCLFVILVCCSQLEQSCCCGQVMEHFRGCWGVRIQTRLVCSGLWFGMRGLEGFQQPRAAHQARAGLKRVVLVRIVLPTDAVKCGPVCSLLGPHDGLHLNQLRRAHVFRQSVFFPLQLFLFPSSSPALLPFPFFSPFVFCTYMRIYPYSNLNSYPLL